MAKTYVKTMNEILKEGFIPVNDPDENGKMVTIGERCRKVWKQISSNRFELIEAVRNGVNV